MGNADVQAALTFHAQTNHSPESIRQSRHSLDFPNQPRPFKLYRTLDPVPSPETFPPTHLTTLRALAPADPQLSERAPDLPTLASILHYSAGITKFLRVPGGRMAFRAAACTGALYHIELYIICGDLPDLAAGVYQFGAHDHALRQLRAGDFRSVVAEATGAQPSVATAPVIIASTSTFWRNAWKYQDRAYRHVYWDNGTILANLLAMAAGYGLPAEVVLGFADRSLNRLLDVDTVHEATVSLVTIGHHVEVLPPSPPVTRLDLRTAPLSAMEVDYPAIHAIHEASSLATSEEVAAWQAAAAHSPVTPVPPAPESTGEEIRLRPLPPSDLPPDPIESTIQRRGSARRFAPTSISFAQLSTILDDATRGFGSDFGAPAGAALHEPYLIVNDVEGLESGTYVFHRGRGTLELLQAGSFRGEAGYLGLTQELAGQAAVNVYFMADLGPILDRMGNRGYRAAQLDASLTAGRMYLASYALGLGATGLTFFDDEVTRFFSPHAAGKSVLFLLAIGNSAPRS